MGCGRLLFWAIAGPALIYWSLIGHVLCRMLVQAPGPIRIDDFPRGTTREQKDEIRAARKPMIDAVKETMGGNKTAEFAKRFLAADSEFEDFWVYVKGDEFPKMLGSLERFVDWTVFETRGEFHGPEEVILDWREVFASSWPTQYTVGIPMRTHLHLRRDKDGKERIARYEEEWWGNKQLNRDTTFQPLGLVHEQLRFFTGQFVIKLIDAGWL